MNSQDIRRRGKDASASVTSASTGQSTSDSAMDEQRPLMKKRKSVASETSSLLKKILILSLVLLLTAFFAFAVICPLVFSSSLTIRNGLLFMNWLNIPLFRNLSNPEGEYGLNCTRNFYIQTGDIKLGTWHILPASRITECNLQSDDKIKADSAFADTNHIILYLHGNGGARGGNHRRELYKVLAYNTLLNYHIVAFDYRGYGDSSALVPSAQGLIDDARNVYQWLLGKVNGDTSRVTVWGHSLGTAVAVHMIASLSPSQQPSSLVLEAPFYSLADAIRDHPIASIFKRHPYFEEYFVKPLLKPETNFDSASHIKSVKSPLLILHAEDDGIIPYSQGVKLYEVAMKSRDAATPAPKLISFDSSRSYGHKAIFKEPQLPHYIWEFVNTYKSASKQPPPQHKSKSSEKVKK